MIRLEIKKNIMSVYFVLSVLILYLIFMSGNSGYVLPDENAATSIIGAIWNKLHGNWRMNSDSSYLVRMYHIWTDNRYLPVLMPIVCGLPCAMHYFEEIKTTNKRFMLVRCSKKEYFLSKITANLVCAVAVAVMAVGLYYVTLYCLFDKIPHSDDSFATVFFVLTGMEIEQAKEASMIALYVALLKGVVYFCLYAGICSSFCFMMAVWCRDKYIAFGGIIFVCYMQCRIAEELARKYVADGVLAAGPAADVISPNFLHYAGRSGFYENKEFLALGITFFLLLCFCFATVWLASRQLDVSER